MKQARIARRNALRAIAGASLALPLLQTFRGFNDARAAVSAYPQRLIIYATMNSGWPEQFWPTLGGQTPIPERPAEGYYVSGLDALDTTDFSLSPILKPLEQHKNRMLILEGIDGFDGGHEGYGSILTGMLSPMEAGGKEGGPSFDQILAKGLDLANKTKFASLQFGVKSAGGVAFSAYDAGMPAAPEDDPARMYDRVFTGFTPSAAGAPTIDPLVARRQSVLHASAKQLIELQARLPLQQDKDKLEAHLQSIREVEGLVGRGAGSGSLSACGKPPAVPKLDPIADMDLPAVAKAHMETMILSLACDLTRVATFQFYSEESPFPHTHPWLGITEEHHNALGHGDPNDLSIQRKIKTIETWQSEQVAYLLDRLASIPEGAGTMLDNTLVVFMQTHTRGHAHSNMNLPIVVAGNVNGALRQGRYVRFKRQASGGDRPVGGDASAPLGLARTTSDLWFTLLQTFGLNPTGFGLPERFTGGVPEIKA